MENMRSLALPVEPASVPAQKQAPDRQFLMFPYLHQDVRLLIWEAALRPRPSKNYNAVHSFRVNFWEAEDPRSHEMSDVGHKSPQIFGYRVMEELESQKMANALEAMSNCSEELKSVVHWDYGMWKACVESRWVISRRFRQKQWQELKMIVLEDLQTAPEKIHEPYTIERAWQKENKLMKNGGRESISQWYRDFVSVVNIDGMFNNIVATHPARDLFMIQDERWMSECTRLATVREQENNAIKLFRENAISATSNGFPIMGNIGFVYDRSWSNGITRNDPRPTTLMEQRSRNNPRGNFLLLLHLCVVRMLRLRLWLIDEEYDPCHTCKTKEDAEEEVDEEKRDRKVFYRYGEEDLVEVDIKPNVMWVTVENVRCILASSCGFVQYLSSDRIVGNPAFNPDPRAKPFDVWKCVGVLAPRSRTPY
ncbi:hypothetical protein FOXG_05838 [Fusarium oxysporum f. sp. lycopersici 4287]|uniref:Uncharacterized protein n=3 Tax=Fusarium oxysporum TaxID=5507 RepID=A0A0J9UUZ4_FUSO4|nr:hypothetical protein FOXG_05838 [Fusarium oxysporum f. sp. lycopersici 4287]XP_018241345.1 hypothetical protein FOXG_05838 [Fusarium oxysporum f. sp. lycopersici 4287]EXK32866.1 hypothetical protein FOMG_11715 [Fusarium oxysporum f. sp. melonis 26406]KAJ9423050.1 hypothetical protein QL093DRAFT_2259639 [Fusarium oxysporum]EXK32867.1 hypothetical protein FOMG_11715 [Fusarium oxysporum f. sp. melonis 26406]KNB03299.1 hypothetical protein FOXG_05838 [Fusarium oxysporum f. sp. lycopersici 4287]